MSVGGMCKDCFSGTLHDGTPTGKVETWFNTQTYVAEPESASKGIVVIIADAFGWELVNNRVLADSYAKKGGFKVLMPDFFHGTAVNPEAMSAIYEAMGPTNPLLKRISNGLWALSLMPGFLFRNRFGLRGPEVYAWFHALRHSEAARNQKIGAAGFCWGGKIVFYLCAPSSETSSPTYSWFKSAKGVPAAEGEFLIDVGYTAHPSSLELPKDAEAVVLPISVANGSKDIQVTPAKAPLVIEAFKRKNEADGVKIEGEKRYVYVNYEGAGHGFAVRNNPHNEGEKEMGEKAEAQAIDFFTKWFA